MNMPILTQFSNEKTMSTREISDLTEKRHPDVKRDQYSKIQAYQKSINQNLVHVVTSAPRIAKWLEKGVVA